MARPDFKRLRLPKRAKSKKTKPMRGTPKQPRGVELQYYAAIRKILRPLREALQDEAQRIAQRVGRKDARSWEPGLLDAAETALELLTPAILRPILRRIFALVRGFSDEQTAQGLGIDLRGAPELTDLYREFEKENVSLIRTIGEDLHEEVRDVIAAGQDANLRAEDIAEDIQGRFGVSESRASLIATDQVLKVNAEISQARQEAVGIKEYFWITARDGRVRLTHADLDGSRQSWDSPPVVSEDGRREHPGGDYRCRCIAQAIVETAEEPEEG